MTAVSPTHQLVLLAVRIPRLALALAVVVSLDNAHNPRLLEEPLCKVLHDGAVPCLFAVELRAPPLVAEQQGASDEADTGVGAGLKGSDDANPLAGKLDLMPRLRDDRIALLVPNISR